MTCAHEYDATLPPRNGCEACIATWQAAQRARIQRANEGRVYRDNGKHDPRDYTGPGMTFRVRRGRGS